MLRGRPQPPEVRSLDEAGEVRVDVAAPPPISPSARSGEAGYRRQAAVPSLSQVPESDLPYSPTPPHIPGMPLQPVRVYAYGVARNRLRQAARRLRVPATLVDEPTEAGVIVTLRAYYRRHQKLIADAEARRIPVYVLRANTVGQMESFLTDLFNLEAVPVQDPGLEGALQETQQAIQNVLNGARSTDLAAGLGLHPSPAAPARPTGQPGIALVRQGAAPPGAHLPRMSLFISLEGPDGGGKSTQAASAGGTPAVSRAERAAHARAGRHAYRR